MNYFMKEQMLSEGYKHEQVEDVLKEEIIEEDVFTKYRNNVKKLYTAYEKLIKMVNKCKDAEKVEKLTKELEIYKGDVETLYNMSNKTLTERDIPVLKTSLKRAKDLRKVLQEIMSEYDVKRSYAKGLAISIAPFVATVVACLTGLISSSSPLVNATGHFMLTGAAYSGARAIKGASSERKRNKYQIKYGNRGNFNNVVEEEVIEENAFNNFKKNAKKLYDTYSSMLDSGNAELIAAIKPYQKDIVGFYNLTKRELTENDLEEVKGYIKRIKLLNKVLRVHKVTKQDGAVKNLIRIFLGVCLAIFGAYIAGKGNGAEAVGYIAVTDTILANKIIRYTNDGGKYTLDTKYKKEYSNKPIKESYFDY